VTRADRFDATDWIEHRVGGVLLIDLAGKVARPLGEDAAGIGRRVEHRDAFGLGEVQKAMPVILTKPDEIEMWMSAPAPEDVAADDARLDAKH
jgi:hypothetical protein